MESANLKTDPITRQFIIDDLTLERWHNNEFKSDLKFLEINDFRSYKFFCRHEKWVLGELNQRLQHPRYGKYLKERLVNFRPAHFAQIKKNSDSKDILLDALFDWEIEQKSTSPELREKVLQFFGINTLRDYNNVLLQKLEHESLDIFAGNIEMPFLTQLYLDIENLGKEAAETKWLIQRNKFSDIQSEEIKLRKIEACLGNEHVHNPSTGLPFLLFDGAKLKDIATTYATMKEKENHFPINLKTVLCERKKALTRQNAKKILMNYGEYEHHFSHIQMKRGENEILSIHEIKKYKTSKDPNNPLKSIMTNKAKYNELLGHLEGENENEDGWRWIGAHLDQLTTDGFKLIFTLQNGNIVNGDDLKITNLTSKSTEKMAEMKKRFQQTTKREMFETTDWIIDNLYKLHPPKKPHWKITFCDSNGFERNLQELLKSRCQKLDGRLCIKETQRNDELSLGEIHVGMNSS